MMVWWRCPGGGAEVFAVLFLGDNAWLFRELVENRWF
jgi:hypothetical protein